MEGVLRHTYNSEKALVTFSRPGLSRNSILLKSVSFKNVLGKLVHPKNHKNGPIEINEIIEAVFVNFWMNQFSQVFS